MSKRPKTTHKYPVGTRVYADIKFGSPGGNLAMKGDMYVYRTGANTKGAPLYWLTPYPPNMGTGWCEASVTLIWPQRTGGLREVTLNKEASTDMFLSIEGPVEESQLKPERPNKRVNLQRGKESAS